jgi:hypothetical protein
VPNIVCSTETMPQAHALAIPSTTSDPAPQAQLNKCRLISSIHPCIFFYPFSLTKRVYLLSQLHGHTTAIEGRQNGEKNVFDPGDHVLIGARMRAVIEHVSGRLWKLPLRHMNCYSPKHPSTFMNHSSRKAILYVTSVRFLDCPGILP